MNDNELKTINDYPLHFREEAADLWRRARQGELSPLVAFSELSALCARYDEKLSIWTRSINAEMHRAGRHTLRTGQLSLAVVTAREQLRAAALSLVMP